MGAQASKEEQLYQQVLYGNVHGIHRLRREGAGLEFIDNEGKTPLIVACMRPELLPIAKALIDLGANINVYRPGCHAGTPLHHAAKRGLELTVNLLLANGASPSIANDDCQTPLDMARAKGHTNVVRAIENRICFFSGWLRELLGPGFLQVFAPQWASRKVWVTVLPCDHRNPLNPSKFELAVYPDLQTAQPKTVLQLWKAKIEVPDFKRTDPVLIAVDNTGTRFTFSAEREGDKEQISHLYNACRGIYQVNSMHQPMPMPPAAPVFPATAVATASPSPSISDDMDLAMAINASIQSAIAEGVPPQLLSDVVQPLPHLPSSSSTVATNGWSTQPPSHQSEEHNYNGWAAPESSHSFSPTQETPALSPPAAPPVSTVVQPPPHLPSSSSTVATNKWSTQPPSHQAQEHNYNEWAAPESSLSFSPAQETPALSLPSAPPVNTEGQVQYPSIDSSPVDLKLPSVGKKPKQEESGGSGDSGTCVICLDAPVEGACIPCGHMAGCMSCLNEIKGKSWGCPVCRADIVQVVKLYAV